MRLASGPGSRAVKYRHLLDSTLSLDDAELSILTVLMLRGPQTPGELKQRSERLRAFAAGEVEETLERLVGRELAAGLPRRPGQKEQRYAQLLGAAEQGYGPPSDAGRSLDERVARLEQEVARLRDAIGRS